MKRWVNLCSGTAFVLLAGASLEIWYPGLLRDCYEWLSEMIRWIKIVVVILFALALLLCCWWRPRKPKRKIPSDNECARSASPYRDPGWKCITGFQFETDLCLARLTDRDPRLGPEQQYLVAKEYVVCIEIDGSQPHTIKVPRGLITDLASVPRLFRWFVGRVGPHLEATIVHDYLYVAWQMDDLPPTDDMRLFSDKVMLAGMLASGMSCKAYAIYWAIRLFGTCIFYGRNPKPWEMEEEQMPRCYCQGAMNSQEDDQTE